MLQLCSMQLMDLRDKTFKGFYVLDAVRSRSLPGGGHGRKDGGGEVEEEVNRHAFTLSRFNAAKRVRFSSNNCSQTAGAPSPREFLQMVRSLEVMINDMEFAVFLMGYPVLYRQPYSAHLFAEKCMFGRHMERERVMEFLLQTNPPSNIGNLGALPITGPMLIGKSTIVEHVCNIMKKECGTTSH
ncbi:hypothetical protein BAE44_0022633 [Dichanthelium oligosanthes]|uniref:Uncharacterized protein n=1 Tax=Dichanthelium oligosanthes TaxID=888268 RepID=A0A1E5UU13_9POAL|nr:hypothetical protein BAE44_0022633 [Dichanthelium oligosanthes]